MFGHSRVQVGGLVGLAFVIGVALLAAQSTSEEIFPGASKASLEARFALYQRAQDDGQWDTVSALLGSSVGGKHLSAEYKACLISQMQAVPMISFERERYLYSTGLRYVPLSRKWLTLDGEGTFRVKSGQRRERVDITAYRDAGEWYFYPTYIDDLWEKTQLTGADFARDHANEVRVANQPTCPVQISHLRAFLDKEIPSLLKIRFRVMNRDTKRIVGIETSPGAELLIAEPALDPGSSREKEVPESRYAGSMCDGVSKVTLTVQQVHFEDGTEWSRPNNTRESVRHPRQR